jgi:hypothetical protein
MLMPLRSLLTGVGENLSRANVDRIDRGPRFRRRQIELFAFCVVGSIGINRTLKTGFLKLASKSSSILEP